MILVEGGSRQSELARNMQAEGSAPDTLSVLNWPKCFVLEYFLLTQVCPTDPFVTRMSEGETGLRFEGKATKALRNGSAWSFLLQGSMFTLHPALFCYRLLIPNWSASTQPV